MLRFPLLKLKQLILLCVKKPNEQTYHNLKCINRDCDQCGVDKFVLLAEEL